MEFVQAESASRAKERGKRKEGKNLNYGTRIGSIVCYKFLENGDIQFVHVMFATLNSHMHPTSPDWTYARSKINETTGSRRTETFNTKLAGTTKMRDGSAYLDPDKVNFRRWRFSRSGDIPSYSIWSTGTKGCR